jgi:polyphosphate kinase
MEHEMSTKGGSQPRADDTPISEGSPDRFINRELSWLAFNERVLAEAGNTRYPLLERLRFLSISASNLDEFYMVRVAGLKGQVQAGISTPSQDGLTPAQQLVAIGTRARKLMQDQQTTWAALRRELAAAGVAVIGPEELSAEDRAFLAERFKAEVFPVLTPLAIDPAHPFPFIANLGLGLALELARRSDGSPMQALLLIPPSIARFVRLPGKTLRFLPLEQMIELFLDRLFPGFSVGGKGMFRLIRDTDVEFEEEAEDLVRFLRNRAEAPPPRRGRSISASTPTCRSDCALGDRDQLAARADDVLCRSAAAGSRRPAATDRRRPSRSAVPALHAPLPRAHPRFRRRLLCRHPRQGHHRPSSVRKFRRRGAVPPPGGARSRNVMAVKQTLYRTSRDSPIVKALIEAAEAGKSVTAMVELRARFDEEANIRSRAHGSVPACRWCYGFTG